jgi:hypothetical protein
MQFREHKGSLDDSMATLFAFTTYGQLIDHLVKREYPVAHLHFNQYSTSDDSRIGWKQTYILSEDSYGAIGFTDGNPTLIKPPNYYEMAPWQPITNPKELKYIGKLGEEVCECGSALFRCVIQGIDEVEPETLKPNRQWLEEEIGDVLAGIKLAREYFNLDWDKIQARRDKKVELLHAWHDALEDISVIPL